MSALHRDTYLDNEARQVSHETIYRSLFIQARGALKKELLERLRRTRSMRRSRHHTQKTEDHAQITSAISIRERPADVDDRAVPGHWEDELVDYLCERCHVRKNVARLLVGEVQKTHLRIKYLSELSRLSVAQRTMLTRGIKDGYLKKME